LFLVPSNFNFSEIVAFENSAAILNFMIGFEPKKWGKGRYGVSGDPMCSIIEIRMLFVFL
jgi:hypothetical protein